MKIERHWATPLVIGTFALMAATGLLMFFHLERALQKEIHEWLGWGVVAAAVLHVTANWAGFQRHLAAVPGRALAGVAVAALIASFLVGPSSAEGGASPPVLAMRAVAGAPLKQVAPLTGQSVETLQAKLAAAGVALDGPDDTVAHAVGDDRERLGLAMRTLFATGGAR